MAGMRVHRPGPPDEPLSVMRWWLVTTVTVVVVLSGGALAMWLLDVWTPVPARVPNPDELRLDRIRTGLTVAAGLAAGVTLLMTLRRQALSERAQRFAESAQRFAQSDALEQRITALYVAAAEQLGNDKAAVRLAGLYALDRLGQDHLQRAAIQFSGDCVRAARNAPHRHQQQHDRMVVGDSDSPRRAGYLGKRDRH